MQKVLSGWKIAKFREFKFRKFNFRINFKEKPFMNDNENAEQTFFVLNNDIEHIEHVVF